jgi:hypothetical protein
VHLRVARRVHHVFVIDQAAGVREQVAQRHRIHGRGQRGQPASNGIVQPQAAVFHQQQDRGRGELLADRGEAVVGGGRGLHAGVQVGEAIAAAHDRHAIAHHQYASARHVAVVVAHQRVDVTGHVAGLRANGLRVARSRDAGGQAHSEEQSNGDAGQGAHSADATRYGRWGKNFSDTGPRHGGR